MHTIKLSNQRHVISWHDQGWSDWPIRDTHADPLSVGPRVPGTASSTATCHRRRHPTARATNSSRSVSICMAASEVESGIVVAGWRCVGPWTIVRHVLLWHVSHRLAPPWIICRRLRERPGRSVNQSITKIVHYTTLTVVCQWHT